MFNILLSIHHLCFVTLDAFFIIFIFRKLFIKTKLAIFLYHIVFFFILFITAVGGGGAQNDGYNRLEKFIELEKNNELNKAKQNLQNYDSMLAIDLQEFKNSEEFRNYLKNNDNAIDKIEAIFIGWLLVLIFDFANICVYVLQYVAKKFKNRFSPMKS